MFVCPSVSACVCHEISQSPESGPEMCALAKVARSLGVPKLTLPVLAGKYVRFDDF